MCPKYIPMLLSKFKTFQTISKHSRFSTVTITSSPSQNIIPPLQNPSPSTQISNKPKTSNRRIEIAKPSDLNKILNFLEKHYLCQDLLSKSLNLCGSKFEPPFEEFLKCILMQGMSLVAVENSRENQILGICVNQKNCKWHGDVLEEQADFTRNENFKRLLRVQAVITREPRMHEVLSQLTIFNLIFLSAKKDQGDVAMELAKVSLNLARDLNFSYARMDCTSHDSMILARKLQGTELWKIPFKRILSADGKQPAVVIEPDDAFAAVYYVNLKKMEVECDFLGRRFMPVSPDLVYDDYKL